MKVAVVDGQGGGIGKAIVEKLKEEFGDAVKITALGTNASATAQMLKAGADEGASGENAVLYNVPKADAILGTVGILAANSMLGELTPAMAKAIAESPALKILIPLSKCNIIIAGAKNEPVLQYIDDAAKALREFMNSGGK